MIARISNAGSFLSGAIQYNTNKVELGGGELIASPNFGIENGTNLEVATATQIMIAQLQRNSRVEKGVFSCNLNPNLEDLSNMESLLEKNNCATKDEFYSKLAAQYMQGMGYGNQPYLVFRHNDIDREHIHIVSIRVDEDGNRINNYKEHERSERVRNEINQAFGLSTKGELKGKDLNDSQRINLVEHRYDFMNRTKKAISDYNEAVKQHPALAAPVKNDLTLKAHQTNLFHHVSNALKYVNENYQPKDLKEYNKILSQFNIVCKKNEGETTNGKRFSGCQYAVLDENGGICSHLMKGSSFGKAYGLNGLEKRFALANDKKSLLENADFSRQYITSTVDAVLKAPVKLDFETLSTHLKDRGITLNLVKSLDDPTKIKGVSFIDNINGTTFNGNNLGKAYSYNNLNKAIELHNKKIDDDIKAADFENRKSAFVPNEQFKAAIRLLNSNFNTIRKESYKLESDAIRSIANRKDQYCDILKEKLLFSTQQADSVFNTFSKLKEKDLPEVDFKETSYAQKQITAAVQFAMHIQGTQEKADFLQRAGVYVSRRYDDLVFSSANKESVQLSFKDICNLTSNSVEPVSTHNIPFDPFNIPEPGENLTRLNKEERQFVNAFVNHDGSKIKGDFSELSLLLDKNEQNKLSSKLYISKEEYAEAFKPLNKLSRTILRENYKYQSDMVANIDNHKDSFISVLKGNGLNEIKAERIYNIYKQGLENRLPQVVENEKNAAINRIVTASLFARNIDNPGKRSEFLMRMGIHAELADGELVLSRDDKREYKISWKELLKKEPRLSHSDKLFIQSVISPADPSARLFTKKERDFVATYVNGTFNQDKVDSRFSTASAYLNKEEKEKVQKLGLSARVIDILDRNKTASIDATVKALITRGLVIKPVEDGLNIIYKVGMHNAKDSSFIALPKSMQDRLRNSDFIEVCPNINRLVLNGRMNSPKMETLKSITRAADYDDPELLEKTIDKIALLNKELAVAMKQAAGNGLRPDYERVANLVFDYKGEKTIILPPPTNHKDSFVINTSNSNDKVSPAAYRAMLDAINNGTGLTHYLHQDDNTQSQSQNINRDINSKRQ